MFDKEGQREIFGPKRREVRKTGENCVPKIVSIFIRY